MTKRWTYTEKWTNDKWFMQLSAPAKLFFLYLCENCDCAGIWEIYFEAAADSLGLNVEVVEQAFREVEKCYVTDGKHIMLVNFLYYQRNLPLNPNNNCHKGIILRLGRHPGLYELVQERWRAKSYVIHKATDRLF